MLVALSSAAALPPAHAQEAQRSKAAGHKGSARGAPAAGLDREAGKAVLEQLATGPAAERRAVLAVLGQLGRAEDLELGLRAAFSEQPGAPALAEELSAAVAALLVREPDALNVVAALARRAPPRPCASLARGIASSGLQGGVESLATLLDRVPEVEVSVLTELGRLAADLGPPFSSAVCAKVRARLSSSDDQVLREAALAAGKLLDDQAVPRLVELLDHPRPPVASAAHFSLRAVTGLTLPASSARWRDWLQGEETWFESEFARVKEGLASTRSVQVLAALRSISIRRLHRLEIAREVEPLLADRDAAVREAACRSLAAIGACAELGGLIDCLEDENDAVARAAWAALEALTGKRLPADAEAWRAACEADSVVVR